MSFVFYFVTLFNYSVKYITHIFKLMSLVLISIKFIACISSYCGALTEC